MGGLLFNYYHQEYIRAAIKATYLGLTLPNYKDLVGVLLIGKYTTFLVITIENSTLTYRQIAIRQFKAVSSLIFLPAPYLIW